MVCLTEQEIKELVEKGQLSSNQLFAERIAVMQRMLGTHSLPTHKTTPTQKINQLQDRLQQPTLTKNQKKNLRKKLKREKEKENVQAEPLSQQDQSE